MQGAGVLAWSSTDQGLGEREMPGRETFSAQLTCIPTHDGEDDNPQSKIFQLLVK